MKLFLITSFYILIISCNNTPPQNPTKIISPPNSNSLQNEIGDSSKIYTVVDEMPRFPGCEDKEHKKSCSDKKMQQYLYKHLKLNPASKDEFLEYKIVLSFVIEKDGTTSNITFLRGKRTAEFSNLLEVIQGMPKWIPGKLNGQIQRVKFHLPIGLHYE